MKTIKLTVFGRVQGVGFRYVTKAIANEMGVKGTVHNNEDGSVTTVATAPTNILDAFIEKIKNNPSPTSSVENYSEQELPLTNFTDFQII